MWRRGGKNGGGGGGNDSPTMSVENSNAVNGNGNHHETTPPPPLYPVAPAGENSTPPKSPRSIVSTVARWTTASSNAPASPWSTPLGITTPRGGRVARTISIIPTTTWVKRICGGNRLLAWIFVVTLLQWVRIVWVVHSPSSATPHPQDITILLAGLVRHELSETAWDYLWQLNCLYDVHVHIIAGNHTALMAQKAKRFPCPPIPGKRPVAHPNSGLSLLTKGSSSGAVFHVMREPRGVHKIPNRIDRLTYLRNYQREWLRPFVSQHLSTLVMVVADLDLEEFAAPSDLLQVAQEDLFHDDYHVLCSKGMMHRPHGYYDIFATVLQDGSFLYPLQSRAYFDPRQSPPSLRSDDLLGDFSQAHFALHVEGTSVLPVQSCFGGTAVYRGATFFAASCTYAFPADTVPPPDPSHTPLWTYANTDDDRVCEHVVFHSCLWQQAQKRAGKSFPHDEPQKVIGISSKLVTKWDLPLETTKVMKSGGYLNEALVGRNLPYPDGMLLWNRALAIRTLEPDAQRFPVADSPPPATPPSSPPSQDSQVIWDSMGREFRNGPYHLHINGETGRLEIIRQWNTGYGKDDNSPSREESSAFSKPTVVWTSSPAPIGFLPGDWVYLALLLSHDGVLMLVQQHLPVATKDHPLPLERHCVKVSQHSPLCRSIIWSSGYRGRRPHSQFQMTLSPAGHLVIRDTLDRSIVWSTQPRTSRSRGILPYQTHQQRANTTTSPKTKIQSFLEKLENDRTQQRKEAATAAATPPTKKKKKKQPKTIPQKQPLPKKAAARAAPLTPKERQQKQLQEIRQKLVHYHETHNRDGTPLAVATKDQDKDKKKKKKKKKTTTTTTKKKKKKTWEENKAPEKREKKKKPSTTTTTTTRRNESTITTTRRNAAHDKQAESDHIRKRLGAQRATKGPTFHQEITQKKKKKQHQKGKWKQMEEALLQHRKAHQHDFDEELEEANEKKHHNTKQSTTRKPPVDDAPAIQHKRADNNNNNNNNNNMEGKKTELRNLAIPAEKKTTRTKNQEADLQSKKKKETEPKEAHYVMDPKKKEKYLPELQEEALHHKSAHKDEKKANKDEKTKTEEKKNKDEKKTNKEEETKKEQRKNKDPETNKVTHIVKGESKKTTLTTTGTTTTTTTTATGTEKGDIPKQNVANNQKDGIHRTGQDTAQHDPETKKETPIQEEKAEKKETTGKQAKSPKKEVTEQTTGKQAQSPKKEVTEQQQTTATKENKSSTKKNVDTANIVKKESSKKGTNVNKEGGLEPTEEEEEEKKKTHVEAVSDKKDPLQGVNTVPTHKADEKQVHLEETHSEKKDADDDKKQNNVGREEVTNHHVEKPTNGDKPSWFTWKKR